MSVQGDYEDPPLSQPGAPGGGSGPGNKIEGEARLLRFLQETGRSAGAHDWLGVAQ